MRPIDADALIKEYEEIAKTLADFCVLERMMCREVIRALQNAPTIEPSKSTDQNVADVPIGETISREEVHKVLSLLATEGGKDAKLLFSDAHEFIDALPSADRPTDKSCRDCPIYSADRPQVNSNSAEEQIAETEQKSNRPKEDSKPEPYVPEASTERVVHCKDCIYSEEIRDGNDMFACNNMNGMPGYVHGDDFCSSGSL